MSNNYTISKNKYGKKYYLYKYAKPSKVEILLNILFEMEFPKLSRTEISKLVFKKNLPTLEIDFYRDGLEKEGFIHITHELGLDKIHTIEYWNLLEKEDSHE